MRAIQTIGIAALTLTSGLAPADVIYQSNGPFGGIFGLWGADVFTGQAVAQRFTPESDHRLDLARLWVMSNDFQGAVDELMTVSIQTDAGADGASFPSGVVLDSTEIEISAIGWNPVNEEIIFAGRPWLFEGVRYWIVCESETEPGEDPVWNFASKGLGFNAFRPWDGPWQPGGSGAELCMTVEATPGPCVADLASPFGVLDLGDIQAFIAAFVAMEPAADIAAPLGVFDLGDLGAFIEVFLAGCP
ncbi:MAG: hypothetical protein K8E66_12250 [Phycisphaerales bacterium]|nr:hypothetical protein [Phycisphaerales bacterium]